MEKLILTAYTLDEIAAHIDAYRRKEGYYKPEAKKTKMPKYVTRKKAAQLLGVSLVTLDDWTRKGLLKRYTIGTRIRYKLTEVIAAVEGTNDAGDE